MDFIIFLAIYYFIHKYKLVNDISSNRYWVVSSALDYFTAFYRFNSFTVYKVTNVAGV
jgi:hypothetical protein